MDMQSIQTLLGTAATELAVKVLAAIVFWNNYWQVYFDTNEAIVKVCQEAGWPVPSALHQVRQV